MAQTATHRIVIAVLGRNRPGIVAAVARVLGEAQVDIREITQSIIDEIFTMTMIADITASPLDFSQLQTALSEAGARMSVEVTLQREDVFSLMHRL